MDMGGMAATLTRLNPLHGVLDLMFPRVCAGCGRQAGDDPGHICWECRRRIWPIQFPFCSVCGNPVAGAVDAEYVCVRCANRRPAYDTARSAVLYDGVVMRVIQEFKYSRGIHLARDLADLLLARVSVCYSRTRIDAIVPVPLHKVKLRGRTYNQARLIADEVGRALDKPVAGRCLARTRITGSQTQLSTSERRDNVKGAFEVSAADWVDGRRILLVDDVMTTGATVDECARVLKEAGAMSVYVATVCRGAAPA